MSIEGEALGGELEEVDGAFWRWRRLEAPRTRDDLGRIDRPHGWAPRWSAADVARYREELGVLAAAYAGLDVSREDRARYVDYRLLGSALARVRFELETLPSWRRDPWFYLDQSIGTIYDALVVPGPLGTTRAEDLVVLLESFPVTLAAAAVNCDELAGELVDAALDVAAGAAAALTASLEQLVPELPASAQHRVVAAGGIAAAALEEFASWLDHAAGGALPHSPVGEAIFSSYTSEVALLPFRPDELLAAGRQEWDRAVAFELFEEHRSKAPPWPKLPIDAAAQCAAERDAEAEVRAFYEEHRLLSQPDWLGHYLNAPRPAYIEPIAWLGVSDDLTGPDRLDEDGVSYVPEPSPELPYFYRANAADPRAGIVHEGAHYQQLVCSWRNERPARRHFYDSCPNEGIAFYNEEMLTQAGLFDDAPITRSIIYNFMRLRALRVEVDVRLALGTCSITDGAELLARRVPMDDVTAVAEAAFFAATPAQGLSYTIGKFQLLGLLADVRSAEGATFSLREFHDWLWRNGNVPFSLLRFERLGDHSELDRAASLHAGR